MVKNNYTNNSYNVFVSIEHHKIENRYFAGFMRVKKNLATNKITAITLGRTCNENYTFEEAKELFKSVVYDNPSSDNRIDLIISSIPSSRKDIIYKHPYAIENENELIRLYKLYQNSIFKGKSSSRIQKIGMGKGLYLDDVSKPVRLRIDFNEIQITTIAIMFAIEEVLKSQTRNLINSILALNEK